MEGTLEEKRCQIRLHYATLIRVLGATVWLLHFYVIMSLSSEPHFELNASGMKNVSEVLHRDLLDYRSKRVYFDAAEHMVLLWNLIYAVLLGGRRNRVWSYVWLHYNWTATPLLALVILVVEFASQDMSYFIQLDDCQTEELISFIIYFLLGFNTYLLAYNHLRFLQHQVTRPFKPGLLLPSRAATAAAMDSQRRVRGLAGSGSQHQTEAKAMKTAATQRMSYRDRP